MSGNWNHWEFPDKVTEGVLSADSTPIEAHTIAINGDITIGPERVKTLLLSREISADSICPGAGACGGQLTANTMATAYEVLGSLPMGWNDIPASDPLKVAAAARASVPVFGAAGHALPNPTPYCPPPVTKAEPTALCRATFARKETSHVRQALG
jgi:dihydroxyacid dehydratase/phosphogluconate dehydratase